MDPFVVVGVTQWSVLFVIFALTLKPLIAHVASKSVGRVKWLAVILPYGSNTAHDI